MPSIDELDNNRVAPLPAPTWTAWISSAMWSRLKLNAASYSDRQTRLGPSSDAQPLRPSRTTRSEASLRLHHEVEEASPRL